MNVMWVRPIHACWCMTHAWHDHTRVHDHVRCVKIIMWSCAAWFRINHSWILWLFFFLECFGFAILVFILEKMWWSHEFHMCFNSFENNSWKCFWKLVHFSRHPICNFFFSTGDSLQGVFRCEKASANRRRCFRAWEGDSSNTLLVSRADCWVAGLASPLKNLISTKCINPDTWIRVWLYEFMISHTSFVYTCQWNNSWWWVKKQSLRRNTQVASETFRTSAKPLKIWVSSSLLEFFTRKIQSYTQQKSNPEQELAKCWFFCKTLSWQV